MDKEGNYEHILDAPTIDAKDFIYDNQPITSDMLIKMAESSSPKNSGYYGVIYSNLERNLNIIMNNLELRDIPEWPMFIDTLKSYEGFVTPNGNQIDKFDGWEKTKDNLLKNQNYIIKIDKEIKLAEKQKPQNGLRVEVKNNNVEFALKKFKRMVKNSGMMLELKKRSYYKKPSEEKREKKNMQKLRYAYQAKKEKNSY